MRFQLGDVWKSANGRRAVVTKLDDDGRTAVLFFEDGAEERMGWMQLNQHGQWQRDTSPRPSKAADELKHLVLAKSSQHPVCPSGWDIVISGTGGGNWKADHVSPHPQIAYADCANYVGGIVRCYGLLFALHRELGTTG